MLEKIIGFSVKNKIVVALMTVGLLIAGLVAMVQLPLDAVPDITNNQVQIVTTAPSLAPQEVERFITQPIENRLANLPKTENVRSITRFGLSVITVIFEDDYPILQARQLVKEQLDMAAKEIPTEFGTPEMMPITSGLGEIYQYSLVVDSAYHGKYSPMELRTIQDWLVKKRLNGTKGIIDISSFGGFVKQYEVSIDPQKLLLHQVSLLEVQKALESNNQNSGGSYVQRNNETFYIRTNGVLQDFRDIENVIIPTTSTTPLRIKDIADLRYGYPPRYGALTMDGKGETVGGITLMLKDESSSKTLQNIHERIAQIQESLPEGLRIEPYLDRSVLVEKAISTVSKNLIEGGLIVIFVLVLLLGNFRAGLIVASVIPLSLLFAFILMNLFGVSANLMSLGAIDFGIVIDGAVIVVEGILHFFHGRKNKADLNQEEMDQAIIQTSTQIIQSAIFGVLIIIVVFLPIMSLTGIEGKMFTPMAKTISFALIGALVLSITYVPMMSALFLRFKENEKEGISDKLVKCIQTVYKPVLNGVLNNPIKALLTTIGILLVAIFTFPFLGAEFAPALEEGDLAVQMTLPSNTTLAHSVATSTRAEQILLSQFPEVDHVVSKIGTAEIPTDPMAISDADIMIIMKPKKEWTSANDRESLVEKMKDALSEIEDAQFDFSQPIELRFNELISGSKNDIAIKLFGTDLNELARIGSRIEKTVSIIPGAADIKLEQTEGLPQYNLSIDRNKLTLYQLNVSDVNQIIQSAYAGTNAGIIYENEKRFDLTLRLNPNAREKLDLDQLFIQSPSGVDVPLSEIVVQKTDEGPIQISRENARRKIAIGVNVRGRDIASFVEETQKKLENEITLPEGYFIEYGGQYENLQAAKKRLSIAVPVSLTLILFLLYFSFKSWKNTFLIFTTVPLAVIGGIFSLFIRDMPFSISAGVGFIALFGVAVLNGIVLVSYYASLEKEQLSNREIVLNGSVRRLRPVLMTALVAALGFLPMALSTSAGAEVQKPLATVVIGGLISSTLMTLFILPLLYEKTIRIGGKKTLTAVALLLLIPSFHAQTIEQIKDSAKVHSPYILQGRTNAEIQLLEGRKAYDWGPTSASYQYGQINSSLRDRFVQINQEINNPVEMLQNKKASMAGYHRLLSEQKLTETQVMYQIEQVYTQIQTGILLVRYLEEENIIAQELIDKIQLQKQAGEATFIELELAKGQALEIESSLHEAKFNLEENTHVLNYLSGIRQHLDISFDSIWLNPVGILRTASNDTSIHLQPLYRSIDEQTALIKWENSKRLPDLSLGYFSQSLDHVYGFQGVLIGVNFSLNQKAQTASKLQVDLQRDLSIEKLELERQQLVLKQEHALWNYQQLLAQWLKYQDNQEIRASDLLQVKLQSGEVSYMDYFQTKKQLIQREIQFNQLSEQLIMSRLQLQYLNQ